MLAGRGAAEEAPDEAVIGHTVVVTGTTVVMTVVCVDSEAGQKATDGAQLVIVINEVIDIVLVT